MQTREEVILQKVGLAGGATNSLTITTIFIMFLHEVMKRLLEETARFVLFPISGAFAIIDAVLAWKEMRRNKEETGPKIKFALEFLSALAIGTAVVGGLAFTALFSLAAPVIFAATLGVKTLYHSISAGYYLGMSVVTQDEKQRAVYQDKAYGQAVGAVALALGTIAVGAVMIAKIPLVAVVGVLSGLISASFAIYKFFSLKMPEKPKVDKGESLLKPEERSDASHDLTSTATMGKTFQIVPGLQRVEEPAAVVASPKGDAYFERSVVKQQSVSAVPASSAEPALAPAIV